MGALFELLAHEAQLRGRADPAEPIHFYRAVSLVRDMPYQRASDRDPQTIVTEWRGTCSGKHYVLDRVAGELEVPSQLYHCTHHFTRGNTPFLPEALLRRLPAGGLPDVHTFLRAQLRGRWVVIDVTWPAALKPLGFPVNEKWNGISDMTIAAEVEAEFPVRGDPQAMKERLLAEHCGPHRAARDAFIQELTQWLAEPSAG